jgi:hypothetical protein
MEPWKMISIHGAEPVLVQSNQLIDVPASDDERTFDNLPEYIASFLIVFRVVQELNAAFQNAAKQVQFKRSCLIFNGRVKHLLKL